MDTPGIPGDAAEDAPNVAQAGWRGRADGLWTLAKRTYHDSLDDRLPGLAAEVSFFTLLSIPPLTLVMLGLVSFVGDVFGAGVVADIRDFIVDSLDNVLTAETMTDVVEPALDDLLKQGRADILGIGLLLAVWSASRAIRVFTVAVTVAYDLEDRRTWWQRRLLALGLTTAGIVAVVVLLPLLVVGPEFGARVSEPLGLETQFEILWRVLWLPVVAVVGLSLLTWVYHVVPPHETRWRRDLPGAVLALVVWVAGSFGLQAYAVLFVTSESAFSLLGTPIVALLWVYVTALALLLGAELNAEIEKLWPDAAAQP